jgi:hypothetical protein
MIIGIILTLFGVAIAIVFGYTETIKETRGVNLFFTLVAIALVACGTILIITELTEGLPKDTFDPYGDYMPPKNLPLVVKMVHIENNFCYMTTAPYNDQNILKQPYYQIPIEKIEDLGDIETGIMVINDNGILKPHKNN